MYVSHSENNLKNNDKSNNNFETWRFCGPTPRSLNQLPQSDEDDDDDDEDGFIAKLETNLTKRKRFLNLKISCCCFGAKWWTKSEKLQIWHKCEKTYFSDFQISNPQTRYFQMIRKPYFVFPICHQFFIFILSPDEDDDEEEEEEEGGAASSSAPPRKKAKTDEWAHLPDRLVDCECAGVRVIEFVKFW